MWMLYFLLSVFIGIIACLALKIRQNFRYFEEQGIPYIKSPHWIFGSWKEFVTGELSFHEATQKLYNAEEVKNKPLFGCFLSHKPILMITDPELIKRITVTDFDSFRDFGVEIGKHDPIGHYSMLFARGKLWKQIRQKFSPFFTSSRLKHTFYLLEMTSDEMITKIDDESCNNTTRVDLKHLFGLCTTDIIARVMFGYDANSLKNPDGECITAAKKGLETSLKRNIEFVTIFFFPKLAAFLDFKFFSSHATNFIVNTTTEAMNDRRQSGDERHDLIDLLIKLDDAKEFESIDVLLAQVAILTAAGYETTSTVLTLAIFEISNNRHVHDKLRSELKKKLQETNGKITYDLLMMTSDFPYLHQVVLETMRKYPAVSFLARMCVNPNGYSLEPFSDFKIPEGTEIMLPSYPIFNDPKNFPDPEKFDPERFADWNNVSPYIFFPMSTGPKNCIGERFGLMAVKLLIVKILMNYRIEHLLSTPKYVQQSPFKPTIQSKVPLELNFIKDPLTKENDTSF